MQIVDFDTLRAGSMLHDACRPLVHANRRLSMELDHHPPQITPQIGNHRARLSSSPTCSAGVPHRTGKVCQAEGGAVVARRLTRARAR